MSCLFCTRYVSIEPDEHKVSREGRECQSHCGNEWDFRTAGNYVRRHNKMLEGFCLLNPTATPKPCNTVCAQIDVNNWFLGRWTGDIRSPKPGEDLMGWAREQMQTYLHGSQTTRELQRERADNKILRQELKIARARSADRLKRLKQAEQKKPKPAVKRLTVITNPKRLPDAAD